MKCTQDSRTTITHIDTKGRVNTNEVFEVFTPLAQEGQRHTHTQLLARKLLPATFATSLCNDCSALLTALAASIVCVRTMDFLSRAASVLTCGEKGERQEREGKARENRGK